MSGDVGILVVDDRAEARFAITSLLARPDYELVTAASGDEALRRVLERDFAVILLDVRMPDLDGFDVAEIIKQRERSRHTPIIFLTAATDTDLSLIYRGYSVGAVDYLVKPLDPDILRAKVAIFADLFRKDRRIRQQAMALVDADRRERERELTEVRLTNERRYRNLAEAVPHIIWTAAPDGIVTYVNARWYEYTARPPGALADGWVGELHPDDRERHVQAWQLARDAGHLFELECRLRRGDGEYRWHLCRAVPEHDEVGAVVAWLGTFTDFHDRRRALDDAHAAVRARDEFLSIAAHELRTPLMTLQLRLESLVTELARPDPGRDRERAMGASAQRQAGRLVGLVESLLDVARIANGGLTLSRSHFDLAEAVREVIGRFTEVAERAGCELRVHVPRPAAGEWDRLRIEQIVQNLIGNALQYAPHAPVEVEVDVDADGDRARLRVRDHGHGIASDDLARVFDRFERAVPARHDGGLGMGLYIVREIARAHGGSIRVDSRLGEGATFEVELPCAP